MLARLLRWGKMTFALVKSLANVQVLPRPNGLQSGLQP